MKGNARDWQTRIRLWAAIIQGSYAVGYTLYYAVGLISPLAMEHYLDFFGIVGVALSWLVLAVLLTHITLGLWKIYQRNTFKMPLWELAQILLGLSIPFFLFPHFADSYGMSIFFGKRLSYVDNVLLIYPALSWQFIAMVLAVGIHAQIGTHAVLRLRRWYPRVRWMIVVVLSIIPILSIVGYLETGAALRYEISSGRYYSNGSGAGTYGAEGYRSGSYGTGRTQAQGYGANSSGGGSSGGAYSSDYYSEYRPYKPTEAEYHFVRNFTYGVYALFGALYIIVFVARDLRLRRRGRDRNITVRYSDGRAVDVFPLTTILEASRIGGIPHASICGGRGRCTTCRVRIDEGMENVSAVGERELRALQRIGAAEGVRLACQTECLRSEVSLTLLLPPGVSSPKARKETPESVGRDVKLAVMFADLRGFTRMSEGKLPYDIVFILNQYFNYIGEAIEANGGTIDKFIGDGILAYFGLETDDRAACKNAIGASRQIAEELAKVNDHLRNVLAEPMRIGIGLHYGDVVLGEVGTAKKSSLTIIGDTVNTASRLETLNKEHSSQLVLSSTVAAIAGIDLTYMTVHSVQVRGRNEPLRVYVIGDILEDFPDDE